MVAAKIENGTSVALVKHEERGVSRVEERPELSFGELVKMGSNLVGTGYLPDHIKNGAQAAAIIMTGRELGMEPMRALRSLYMVKGKVVEDASSQLARFKSGGGHATFVHLDEKRATLKLRHPNGDEHTETFTIEDAKAAGLSGDNWRKYPKAMLRSRVITAGLKSLGWEGGVGAYDPDEAVAFTDTPAREERHIEATIVHDDGPSVDDLKNAALDELRRLKVGDGMTKDETKAARVAAVERLNGGRAPKTAQEWSTVLEALRAEPTPTDEENSAG